MQKIRNLIIEVPNFDESFSRVVLDGRAYLLQFKYNHVAERWRFGVYTLKQEPIAIGMAVVPQFPLNFQVVDDRMPNGLFVVFSNFEHIRRNDFVDGNATFVYVPREMD